MQTIFGQSVGDSIIVTRVLPYNEKKGRQFIMQCPCGVEFKRAASHLKQRNDTVLCRTCLVEKSRTGCFTESKVVHGETGTPLHNAWIYMRRRCYDKNLHNYANWGGRGIKVCDEWVNDYIAFARYSRATIGERPSKQHSIDRIDNEGDYAPGNIRWASPKQQANNRRIHPVTGGHWLNRVKSLPSYDDPIWLHILEPFLKHRIDRALVVELLRLNDHRLREICKAHGIKFRNKARATSERDDEDLI